jgi:type IX secretion system PorP/SprF family membrane protein
MKKIHKILAIALLLTSSAVMAQQESVISFYRLHMNLVNPAYVGVDSMTIATSSLRKQWTGVAEAPETQTVSFGTYLGKNVGFGMTVIHDQTFVEKQTYLTVDFSYKLKMSETADVYFGIKAGGNTYNVNTTGLETYNLQSDPALGSINTFNPNLGVGALYKEGALYISLSIPRLLNTKRATNDAGYASVKTDSPHIYLSGGYDIPFFDESVLAPNLAAILGIVALMTKVIAFIFLFMWVRWTIPRFRYDQLMHLGWRILIPLALFNMLATGGVILYFNK